jgi:hypothetical protein
MSNVFSAKVQRFLEHFGANRLFNALEQGLVLLIQRCHALQQGQDFDSLPTYNMRTCKQKKDPAPTQISPLRTLPLR